ncbi:hypothetical protein [Ferruginibacter sp. SUN106]|uniref:hypothetical protein n=1 Tax=Ferruginibacter sp. SUN106 TaxID=2978348 RepID=UPI003D36843D
MKLKYTVVFTVLFFSRGLYAQNLTGTWEGTAGSNYCKIVIFQVNDSCFGYTYDTGMGYCKANFTGTYDDSTKKLKGKNTDFIERTAFHALSIYHLTYSKRNNEEYLRGRAAAKTAGAKILSFGLPILVTYRKISDKIDTTALIATKIYFYNDDKEKTVVVTEKMATPKAAAVKDSITMPALQAMADLKTIKESRTSRLAQTIESVADSIKMVLYDNGEIDGDTVTVFDNGKIVVEKLALSLKPYEVTIPLNKNSSFHNIELMANNLGSIPPNTAYMLILAGKERYELRLASDFSVNAQINIKYKDEIK